MLDSPRRGQYTRSWYAGAGGRLRFAELTFPAKDGGFAIYSVWPG